MSKKLFVGGLSWNTTEDQLRDAFAGFGELTEVAIIMERDTGRSRGFGFVTFADPASATKAITEMDGKELDGRNIKVDAAKERTSRGGGGGGGGYGNRW
jgi:cold-inducible RNA-binding protein